MDEREKFEQFGRAVMARMRDAYDVYDTETTDDICEIAQKFGLAEFVVYDPAAHGEIDEAEPGDMVWIWTTEARDA